MIIRQILKEIGKRNWQSVVSDLLVVFIGVFTGLQVSNWNDARIEQAKERGYLIRLHEDIMASARGLEEDRVFLLQQISDQRNILTSLNECQVSKENLVSVHRGFLTLGWINAPRFVKRTVDEMGASGHMNILQSTDIKKELAKIIAEFDFRLSAQESTFRLVEYHRVFIDSQVNYNVPNSPSKFGTVTFDIEMLCKIPKNASVISAINFYSRERFIAFTELHKNYLGILPLIDKELYSRWSYEMNAE
jgi:hypothetical protein